VTEGTPLGGEDPGLPPPAPVIEGPVCAGCAKVLVTTARFCPDCGTERPDTGTPTGTWSDTIRFLWAAGLIIAYILATHIGAGWTDYQAVLAVDAGFLLLVCGVAVFFHKELRPTTRPRRLTLDRFLTYLIAQLAITCLALFGTTWLSHALGLEELSYTWVFRLSPAPLLFSLLSTAVMPAVTEELAFRGILFGQLERLSGTASAVIVTGILFAFVHFSMLSVFWLVPVGLLYGWIRAREGHIWLGMAFHMAHNALVVFQEFGYF
jgi:uncharacterized protein